MHARGKYEYFFQLWGNTALTFLCLANYEHSPLCKIMLESKSSELTNHIFTITQIITNVIINFKFSLSFPVKTCPDVFPTCCDVLR